MDAHRVHPKLVLSHNILHVFTCCNLILTLFLTCYSSPSYGQENTDDEDVSVFLNFSGLGTTEIPAVIRQKVVYLSVTQFFNFLKINNTLSIHQDSVSGFLLNPKDIFLIDKLNHIISYGQSKTELAPQDVINTANDLYLNAVCFGKIFGLNCQFSSHALTVNLDTKLDLPIIRVMRQQLMRDNINRIQGLVKADTTIDHSHVGLKLSVIDWSVIATQQQGANYTGLNLSLGGVMAGGETDVSLNYYSNSAFSSRNLVYLWRYVDNDNPLLRQVTVGKIAPPSIVSIFAPVTGVQFTNTSSLVRNLFGTYKISDFTEPGWKIELYINNELVDYKQADAAGFFTFNVPIIYGNTLVDLRFYGPWGEERSQRRNINIPFNFLPKNGFEYTLYGGIVEDGSGSRYTRGSLNYGISQRVTIGGGVEYLSSIPSNKMLSFLTASLRLAPNLLLYGEYAYGVRAKGILNYRLKSDLEVELDYTLYNKDQKATLFNYLEERKLIINLPVKKLNMFYRLTLEHIKLPFSQYLNAELICTGTIIGISTNLTTFSRIAGANAPITYSILSQSYKLPQRMLLTPRIQYEYETKQFINAKIEVERPILNRGYIKLSTERDFLTRSYNTVIGFRYDFSFARTSITATHSGYGGSALTQTASGSLLYDKATHYLAASNNNNVGKAGFIVVAYLDINGNGRRDSDEPKLTGLTLRINGGITQYSVQDTLVRILNLEPYRNYTLQINPNSFDNIAWRLKKCTISAMAEPNQFKLIELSVNIIAEVSGTVSIKTNGELRGLGKIKINFYDKKSTLIAQVLTENDGYFSYFGLAPGAYTVGVDTIQLQRLQIKTYAKTLPITIRRRLDGDVVDGLVFVLNHEQK